MSDKTQSLREIHDGAETARRNLLFYTDWVNRSKHFTGLNFLDGHVDDFPWERRR